VQARMKLAAKLVEIKSSSVSPQQKQQEINREVNALVLQTRGAVQVSVASNSSSGGSSSSGCSARQQHSVTGVYSMSCYPAVMSTFGLRSRLAGSAKSRCFQAAAYTWEGFLSARFVASGVRRHPCFALP
jgi:hypothetical protein